MTAREARRERLEQAAERLGELEQALEETRQALTVQLGENADLRRRLDDTQALLSDRQRLGAERRTLLDVITQSTETLKGMET